MKYQLGRKAIQLDGKRIDKNDCYGQGATYKYADGILKVLDHCDMDEETAKYLTNLSTSRILLPKKLLYQDRRLAGYSLKKIPKLGSSRKLITEPVDYFLHEVLMVEEETHFLSQRGILLNGISPDHSIYNGELYLTDPSKFSLLNVGNTDDLDRLNQYQLHLLISELLLSDMRRGDYSSKKIMEVRNLFNSKEEGEFSSEFFSSLLEDSKDVKQFIKKL